MRLAALPASPDRCWFARHGRPTDAEVVDGDAGGRLRDSEIVLKSGGGKRERTRARRDCVVEAEEIVPGGQVAGPTGVDRCCCLP